MKQNVPAATAAVVKSDVSLTSPAGRTTSYHCELTRSLAGLIVIESLDPGCVTADPGTVIDTVGGDVPLTPGLFELVCMVPLVELGTNWMVPAVVPKLTVSVNFSTKSALFENVRVDTVPPFSAHPYSGANPASRVSAGGVVSSVVNTYDVGVEPPDTHGVLVRPLDPQIPACALAAASVTRPATVPDVVTVY